VEEVEQNCEKVWGAFGRVEDKGEDTRSGMGLSEGAKVVKDVSRHSAG
jgi:hypothetical protein